MKRVCVGGYAAGQRGARRGVAWHDWPGLGVTVVKPEEKGLSREPSWGGDRGCGRSKVAARDVAEVNMLGGSHVLVIAFYGMPG